MRPEGLADAPAQPAKARVFFALWPSGQVAGQLAGIALGASTKFGGKPTRRETIHLTLAFLGDVVEPALPSLCELGQQVQAKAFDLEIDHLGFWANHHLLWAGCSAPPKALGGLVAELQRTLARGGFAVADAKRTFVPHISLVRKLNGAPEIAKLSDFGHIAWPARRFVLVRSRLSAAGPDYQQIAEFPLLP